LTKKIFSLIVVTIITFSAFFNVYADDKSYGCQKLDINITLRNDGTALFEEFWTMKYVGGKFTRFERNIPLGGNYSIKNFKVSEGDVEYAKLDKFDNNRPLNSYAIETSNKELKLEAYYSATDETKTFKMSYVLENAVVIHGDIAEFYWKVIGDEWQIPLNDVSVNIYLPNGAKKEDIRAWAHGPLTGLVSIESANLVKLTVDKVPTKTFIEARIVTPKNLFMESTNFRSGNALDKILAEEQGFADRANAERDSAKKDVLTFIILPILLLIILATYVIVITVKIRKRFTPVFKPDYYREISGSGLSPSEVIDLMGYYGQVVAYDERFTSTLMDLSLKGFVTLSKDENLSKNNLIITLNKKTIEVIKNNGFDIDYSKNNAANNRINSNDNLKPHEVTMLKFLYEMSDDNYTLTSKSIKKYTEKHSNKVLETLNNFTKQSYAQIKARGYIDESLKKYVGKYVLAIIAFIAFTVISFVFQQFVLGTAMLILTFITIFSLVVCRRLSQSGEDELALWQGYKNFLKDFTSFNEKELPDLILWEKYIVYAVAIGMGKKILKDLPKMYPQLNDANYYHNHNM